MAKSLEQPEIKEWLGSTKDMLMAEKSGKDKDDEGKKLNDILENFDKMMPKIADTRAVVDCLWKCYQVSALSTYLGYYFTLLQIIFKMRNTQIIERSFFRICHPITILLSKMDLQSDLFTLLKKGSTI